MQNTTKIFSFVGQISLFYFTEDDNFCIFSGHLVHTYEPEFHFVIISDLGEAQESESDRAATEVLCFMAVCVNGNYKIPLGYFLVAGLKAAGIF